MADDLLDGHGGRGCRDLHHAELRALRAVRRARPPDPGAASGRGGRVVTHRRAAPERDRRVAGVGARSIARLVWLPSRDPARADPRPRRRDGDDAPGVRVQRGRLPRRPVPRPSARPARQQRRPVPDPARRRSRRSMPATWTPGADDPQHELVHRDARSPRPTTASIRPIVRDLNVAAARLARDAADAAERADPDRPRFVAGSLGPTNRTASMSADVGDPAARSVTWEELEVAYRESAAGPDRGRRRPPADRDDLRHAQRQGRDLRGPVAVRRARRAAAADHLAGRSSTRRAAPCRARRSRRSGTASATPTR